MDVKALNIFYLDDLTENHFSFSQEIQNLGGAIPVCSTNLEAKPVLEIVEKGIDIAFMDYHLGEDNGERGITGLTMAKKLSEMHEKAGHKIPIYFILITAYGSENVAINTLKTGLFKDYINKTININTDLSAVFARFDSLRKAQVQIQELEKELQQKNSKIERLERLKEQFYRNAKISVEKDEKLKKLKTQIIGESMQIMIIKHFVQKYADVDDNVLIIGESGTGKDLVADNIHYLGRRQNEKFKAINCAAFSEEFIVSELFGYVPGAFTDANKKEGKTGLLQQVDRGTIFLDEIDRMSLSKQAILLRFIEDQQIRPIGAVDDIEYNMSGLKDLQKYPKKVDVRIIAAIKPTALIDDNGIHKILPDLYGRLQSLFPVIPKLEDRKEDIPLLVNHFLDQIGFNAYKEMHHPNDKNAQKQLKYEGYKKQSPFLIIDSEGMALLKEKGWKKNHVRELKKFVENLYTIFLKGKCNLGDTINNDDIKLALHFHQQIHEQILDTSEDMQKLVDKMVNNPAKNGDDRNYKDKYDEKDIERVKQRMDLYVEAVNALENKVGTTAKDLQSKAYEIYEAQKSQPSPKSQKDKFPNNPSNIGTYFSKSKNEKNFEIASGLFNEFYDKYKCLNNCNVFPFVPSHKKNNK